MYHEVSFYCEMFDYYDVEKLILFYIFDVDLSRIEGYDIYMYESNNVCVRSFLLYTTRILNQF